MLTGSCDKLSSYNWKQQGCGELDMSKLLSAQVPSVLSSLQGNAPSTGTGSLEAARGTDHITLNGVVLQGEQDIFGAPFNSAAMAALEAAGSSWSGGTWNGSSWSGSSWSGSSWSGSSWSGSSWSGSSWSGSSWSSNSWSGSSWSGSSWSGSSWSGSSWSGSSWSGGSWLGASWG
jgi:serine protease AprX